MKILVNQKMFELLLSGWLVLAPVIFVVLFFFPAPYGRHWKNGWGAQVPSRVGWIIMELVSLLGMTWLFLTGTRSNNAVAVFFLALWLLHYGYRALLFPLTRRYTKPSMPFVIVLFGMVFNICNSFFNGFFLFHLAAPYPTVWFMDMRFILGVILFLAGFGIHTHSDHILNKLKSAQHSDYRIPYGGFFRWVSCPNYFGEIIEWTGWALATWSLAGLGFALWTVANLVPRALFHHKWYYKTFRDYPPERKALVPFLF
jgi:3-oxo-5-alpha-steroid 4-dehydrogenase 1